MASKKSASQPPSTAPVNELVHELALNLSAKTSGLSNVAASLAFAAHNDDFLDTFDEDLNLTNGHQAHAADRLETIFTLFQAELRTVSDELRRIANSSEQIQNGTAVAAGTNKAH